MVISSIFPIGVATVYNVPMEDILHLDAYLRHVIATYGTLTYGMLFLIVFAETGLVITPFLPGDSLLFASGAVASMGLLSIEWLLPLLTVAAIGGDTVNYWIGHAFGKKIVDSPAIPFIRQEHIRKTEKFFQRYGVKTIVLARFVPIVRTFAPFVAGVGSMKYRTFLFYNITGGAAWILLFTLTGYFFGTIPIVRENTQPVIIAIVLLSVLPIVWERIRRKIAGSTPPRDPEF